MTTKTKKPNSQVEDRTAFRKLSPEEQMRSLRGTRVERTFQVERDTVDEESRTVKLSISSERPYERWWGVEILDHGPSSLRDERLKLGAPLLVGHDSRDQVGVVEGFEITPDRKLRITARFSKSARAQEIWQDVLDGIRRNTSVGYMIHEMVLEKQSEEVNTYRVTDWEPYEGSLVSVPADPSVGVGRAHDPEQAPQIEERTMPEVTTNPTTPAMPAVDAAAVAQRELERINGILAAGDEYKDFGGPEVARSLVRDPKATLDTFRAAILEKMRAAPQKPLNTAQAAEVQDGPIRMRYRYGKLKAFTKDLTAEDGRTIKAEEAAYRSGQWVGAVIYGNEKARKWCQERGIDTQLRVMTEGVNTTGGVLVPDEMETAIIDLRDEYGVARRLARVRPMGSDTRVIPRRTGGITAYFVNEDNDGVTASDKNWDNVSLSAKTLAALGLMSIQYIEDAIIDVADDFAQEMALAFATKEDECFINGTGTSTYGGMHGLVTKFEATAYASRQDAASGHDTLAEIDSSDLASVMGKVRAYAKRGAVWLCSSTAEDVIFGRLKAAAGGNTMTDLAGRPIPSYLGYPIITSESMLSAVDAQNDKVLCMFGNFNLSSSFGARRGITVQILRERYAEKLQVGVLGHERFDIVNHDLGTTSVKGPVAALLGTT
jgi:HK97 family phage major capsid protein